MIFTTWSAERAVRARSKALELFAVGMVSEMQTSVVNGYKTFVIGPDGSGEGWELSNNMDIQRDAFLKWISQEFSDEDGGNYFNWAVVQYGDDNGDNSLVYYSDR
jgi:hypothetical protein